MTRVFMDTSALYSAAWSQTGGSFEIIQQVLRGQLRLVLSTLVKEEAQRNLAEDLPAALPLLETFFSVVPHELVDPTLRQVRLAARHTVAKDAPILAAAKRAKVDYLVTLDKKDLLGHPELEGVFGVRIVTPGTFLREWRATQLEESDPTEGGGDV